MPCRPSLVKLMKQEITLSLGGIHLKMRSSTPLKLSGVLSAFCVEDHEADYILDIAETETMPSLPDKKFGEDFLEDHYEADGLRYAVAKPGSAGLIAMTAYKPDFSQMTMYLRQDRPPQLLESFEKVLQLFPIRALLAQNQAMMLHSSQIAVNGRGILFTAPSGTGKTTQARLWAKRSGVKIVCNDRTLLRKQENCFCTSGYPIDGSSPVYSTEVNPLAAIVVLSQAKENQVERLKPSKALKYLMEQTVADIWNIEEQRCILGLWMDLLEQYPVYHLACTPSQDAVVCLQNRLEKDEVI